MLINRVTVVFANDLGQGHESGKDCSMAARESDAHFSNLNIEPKP
jgi:hypothetical protein